MTLHPVLEEKLNTALAPAMVATLTRRDAVLPDLQNKAHAVTGMRRAGKTSFLRQLVAERQSTGSPERAVYISFDDDRLADIKADQLSALLEAYYRRFPDLRRHQTVSWFLDEIQLVPGWERFVRRVLDTERVELVVSGSSARMLSREVHTSLRGRGFETIIRPFSFREFLRHRDEEPVGVPQRWTADQRSLIEKRFGEYLQAGGIPEAPGPRSRSAEPNLLPSSIRFCCPTWFPVRGIAGERPALDRTPLFTQSGCEHERAPIVPGFESAGSCLSQGFRSRTSGALDRLLPHFDGFPTHGFGAPAQFQSAQGLPGRVQMLIHAFDVFQVETNLGHALETAVFNELQRRGADVEYIKTADGFEVDFHVRYRAGERALLQVCADPASEQTRTRELRALGSAAKENPKLPAMLLVLTQEQAAALSAEPFRIVPAYEWMLEQ